MAGSRNPNIIVITCLLILCLFTSVQAGETHTGRTEVKVAIAHWPPWTIIDNGISRGIDIEILRRVETYVDVRFTFVECPWRRCLYLLKEGQVDMISSFAKRPERLSYAGYIGAAYVSDNIVFYSVKGKSHLIHQYEDLYNTTIGAVKGVAYFKRFDRDKSIVKTELTNEKPLLKMLLSGRLDVAIGYETTCDYLIAVYGYKDRFEKSPLKVAGQASYFAISKKSKVRRLIPELVNVIERMSKSGETGHIVTTFLEKVKQSSTTANTMK